MSADLPARLKLEVKTARGGTLTLDGRDLSGIAPDGHLAALLTDRMVHGPAWVLVPHRLLSARSLADAELHELRAEEPLARILNAGWSDWLLDEPAWRRLLEGGGTDLAGRLAWCRAEHPPRRNRTRGALREAKLHRALERFRAAIDETASGSGGPQAEGRVHQHLLEDVLRQSGYSILANPVGVPDIHAERVASSAADAARRSLEAWRPGTDPLERARRALLDLDGDELLALLRRL